MTTAAPPGAGRTPGWVIPDDDVAEEDVDVRSLAGTQPPADGAWLWVTTAESRRAGKFTALALPRANPRACGGDVLLHVAPGGAAGYLSGAAEEREAPEASGPAGAGLTAAVRVLAVVAGSLVHVASWDHLNMDQWLEQVRGTVAFAMDALRELREHGAGIGVRDVEVEPTAQSVAYGLPALSARVDAAGG